MGPVDSVLDSLSLINHALDCSTSVSQELSIDSLERSVSLSGLLADAVSVCLPVLVVIGMILALCHFLSDTLIYNN